MEQWYCMSLVAQRATKARAPTWPGFIQTGWSPLVKLLRHKSCENAGSNPVGGLIFSSFRFVLLYKYNSTNMPNIVLLKHKIDCYQSKKYATFIIYILIIMIY